MNNCKYFILLVIFFILSGHIFAVTRIVATPEPARLQYVEGDNNRITIRIFVTEDGIPVPDGTPVFLTTTLGSFVSQTIFTQNGNCIAILENFAGAGRSTINIMSGSADIILNVE